MGTVNSQNSGEVWILGCSLYVLELMRGNGRRCSLVILNESDFLGCSSIPPLHTTKYLVLE